MEYSSNVAETNAIDLRSGIKPHISFLHHPVWLRTPENLTGQLMFVFSCSVAELSLKQQQAPRLVEKSCKSGQSMWKPLLPKIMKNITHWTKIFGGKESKNRNISTLYKERFNLKYDLYPQENNWVYFICALMLPWWINSWLLVYFLFQ